MSGELDLKFLAREVLNSTFVKLINDIMQLVKYFQNVSYISSYTSIHQFTYKHTWH
jgi:hypothetical protein